MYVKLSFMVHGHCFNLLSFNLVKLLNSPLIGGLTTIKLLFSRKIETIKVSNLFDVHHMLVKDSTMH